MVGAEFGRPGFGSRRSITWIAILALSWESIVMMECQPVLASDKGAPPTKITDVVDELHGEKVADPYRWLEEGQNPETRSWIDAQNARTTAVLSKFPGRDALTRRCTELLKVDSVGMPTARGNRYFFSKRDADQDLPAICLRTGLDGKDEVLLDPQLANKEHTTTYSVLDVSEDGKLLIYGVRQGGEDEVSVKFFDVETRKDLDFELPRARFFGVSLTPDKKTLYYTIHGKEGSRVYRRPFKSDGKAQLIFGEGYEPLVGISPSLSRDGKYLLLHVWYGSAGTKTDVYFQDLQNNESQIKPLVNDLPARFEVDAVGDHCFIQTNWEAPHGRILQVDMTHPERENWKELIASSESVIEGFSLVGGNVYVQFLDQVRSRVTVFDTAGKKLRDIQFPSLGTVSAIGGEWNKPEAFYTFSTYHIPTTIFREDTKSGEQFVWAKSKVPVDSDRFEVRQVFFKSKDGTRIPMFLVHRKDLKRDGTNPTILYGYGGFNISLTPAFSAKAVQWCELGGIYAVANLRGGGEFGEDWHKAGMGEHKQNVFDDFYAAAEWLVHEKYTSSEKLAIDGRSNGGLLVGTALTQRPELFRAVVCGYPLLDMVRFHKFLVARFWIPEYGSADDANQFKVLKAYSPYHNIKAGTKYPAVLFVTGDADTRVDPLHARKMAAALQAATGSDHPVLLRYDTKLGHTGARPVSHTIDDVTNELSFLCQELGVAIASKETATSSKNSENTETQRLHAIFDREWEYGLKEAPTFASHLGDKRYNHLWPDVSLAAIDARRKHAEGLLAEINTLKPADLTTADRLNLQLFRKQVEMEIEEYGHRWYLVPLTMRDGIQDESSVADSLSFKTVKDYEDWLSRLENFPNYMSQTIDLMRLGINGGLVQSKIVMARVPAQIKQQIVENPELSLYFKPFKSFPDSISVTEQTRLKEAAKQAIATRLVPAYREFLKFFNEQYLPACLPEVGVWQVPGGHEIYAFRTKQFTTTTLTPREIHDIGKTEVARIRNEMAGIIQQVAFKGTFKEFLQYLRTEKKFYCDNDKQLFAEYQAVCKRVDPELPKLFGHLPKIPYDLQPIPAHMAPDTTAAYYRQPAADGSRPGTYFVNLYKPEARPRYEMEALSLHEAVPGHHLQIAIATELEGVPTFRRFTGFTAYVEGWALYSESLGGELGMYKDPYSKFGQLTYEMWRAVRLVVDTGMHEFKWTRQQSIDYFLENTAKTELDITNEVDRYIAWPGQALAYKIGELKIKALRARAEQELGAKFDIRQFHDTVLGQGAVPLDVLEQLVNDWIKSKK
jgi:uncharacterized protein (DUF885 family)/prolyl oligopeptidase PreP (S9A serine peptidase family)